MLPGWWEAGLYDERERAALALTESMTRLSEHQDVPDEIYDAAAATFDDAQLSAVIWLITVINAWNRLAVTTRSPLPV
ncbi:carboxymuconolactone decarboxylase family protein [Amycolatopsis antarctica]|uniref:carboxymuconolactone decarboxylase family protein n=1 Tax=Amycolatopsis antarctica TaxID=1854586 RepID=UPI001056AD6E|nr:hypothetical protein [Amycolatopsis antarctica]